MPDGLRTTPPAPEDAIREFHEIVRNRAAVFLREGDGAIYLSYEKWCRLDIALASLVAAKEEGDEALSEMARLFELVTKAGAEQAALLADLECQRDALAEALRAYVESDGGKLTYPGILHPIEERRLERARAALAALSEPEIPPGDGRAADAPLEGIGSGSLSAEEAT